MAEPVDVGKFLNDHPALYTMAGSGLYAVGRWVWGRFAALETRLVQEREKHDLAMRQLKAHHRQELQEATRRCDEMEAELRHMTVQLAQLTQIDPEAFAPRPRRSRRPKPTSTEEEET